MVSKILLIVLISCTAVFASPIDRKNAAIKTSIPLEGLPDNSFAQALFQFLKNIGIPVDEALKSIEQRMDSKKYREALVEFEKIKKIIYNEEGKLLGNAETRVIIKQQLEKVNNALEKIYREAVDNWVQKNKKIVDATEFKNAMDELKRLVVKLYHKQVTQDMKLK